MTVNARVLGLQLGAANVAVIAACMGIALPVRAEAMDGHAFVSVMTATFMAGILPGIVVGAMIGWFMELLERAPVWVRCLFAIAPAVALVIALGTVSTLDRYILVSCIPTVAAALLLEKKTRLPAAVPLAQVQR